MSESWYKLVFKQNQPIHVGSAKWGVVKETDIFISGQTMWGALTNAYIQTKKISANNELEIIKKYFEQISNFFPGFNKTTILTPAYKYGKFFLGDFSEEEFRFYFVDTLVKTAVTPVVRAAKDESLHEIDFILPKPKQTLEKFEDNLYWIGIIQIDDILKSFFQTGMKIYIGANARYGYGEMELINTLPLEEKDKDFWWIKENGIKTKNNESTPYFIPFSQNLQIEGEVQLLTEMDFRQNTPIVNEADFYISVGSKIKSFAHQEFYLFKGKLKNANSD